MYTQNPVKSVNNREVANQNNELTGSHHYSALKKLVNQLSVYQTED